MTQSLELLLDDATDAAVRHEWDALARAGLPSQADHRGASNRPHVTLAVRDELDLEAVDADGLPLEITLGPPIVLGRDPRWVLARSVVPSTALLALHSRLHRMLGPGDDAPHSAPGSWTPHVTLARRLSPVELGAALTALSSPEPQTDLHGAAVGLRHWDGIARVETSIPVAQSDLRG